MEAGFSVIFLRMMESPGNYLVVMKRRRRGNNSNNGNNEDNGNNGNEDRLELPCSYTGKVISAAGTYQHATLVWHPTMAGDVLSEKHWVSQAKTLMDCD